MLVVSDTTPLHYLVWLNKAELLRQLFGEIVIPEAVLEEMAHPKTPDAVKDWIKAKPSWVLVKKPARVAVSGLGKGESEAIALAQEMQADALLLDDRKAVHTARQRNLLVITTLGLLELAAIKGLINLPQAFDELAQTSFRMPSAEIVADFLQHDAERKATRESS